MIYAYVIPMASLYSLPQLPEAPHITYDSNCPQSQLFCPLPSIGQGGYHICLAPGAVCFLTLLWFLPLLAWKIAPFASGSLLQSSESCDSLSFILPICISTNTIFHSNR